MKAIAIFLCLGVSACASFSPLPNDVRFISIEVIDAYAHPEIERLADWLNGTHMKFIVTISTNEDLVKVAKRGEYNLFAEARLCSTDKFNSGQMGGDIYWENMVAYSGFKDDVYEKLFKQHIPSDPFIYRFSFEISSPGSKVGASTWSAYDLLKEPADVCAQVGGGNMFGMAFRSNQIVIPRQNIEAALKRTDMSK